MLRLRDIMTTDVQTMSPDLNIRDAMDILVANHISGAPVVANGKVVGIITTSDLLAFAASLPGVPAEHPEQEEWGEFGGLPEWTEGEEAPGAFFTEMWDDAGAEVSERIDAVSGPEWNVLLEHTVSEAMTAVPLCSLSPNATVEEAAAFMHRAGVHRVLVMEHGRLVGIVTSMDLAGAVADHKLTTRTYTFGREAAFDARGWDLATVTVPSGELPDERVAGPPDEVPSGELEEDRRRPAVEEVEPPASQ